MGVIPKIILEVITMTDQRAVKNGQVYIQIVDDSGNIVYEFPEVSQQNAPMAQQMMQPNMQMMQPQFMQAGPVVQDVTNGGKMSSKVKKGIFIAAGVAGGAAAYFLGGKRGRATGEAEGYLSGYQAGQGSIVLPSTTESGEAPE